MKKALDLLVEKVLQGNTILQADANILISDKTDISDVMSGATRIREHYKGNIISLCGIVNAKSGLCRENCAFCAQSTRYNVDVERFPLLEKEKIVAQAREAKRMHASHFGIVTSGKKVSNNEIDSICKAITSIVQQLSLSVDASLGTLPPEQLDRLKKAGLKRYHHNLETSERFFPNICSTHTYQDRVATVEMAKKVGLEVCSGGLFGLGEEWQDRIDLAMVLKELNVDSVPLNFLVPVSGTPLGKKMLLSPSEALRIVALFRFILPDKDIRVCGGRENVFGDQQDMIFSAGANGMMIGNYLTRKGRSPDEDLKMIEKLGFEIEER